MNEVIERWDAFLGKIKSRGQELFDSARTEGMKTFRESGNDPMPVGNAISGIRMQVLDLGKKIDDTWSEKVDDAMRGSGISYQEVDAQQRKGETLRFDLECGFEHLQSELYYEMSNVILELAKQNEQKTFNCTQCQAPLDAPQFAFKATRVNCHFCQTVNTFEPGTYGRMAGWFCADNIARWKTWDLKKREMEADHATHYVREALYEDDDRDHTINYDNYDQLYKKAKEEHRKAYQAYWEAYYKELAAMKPDTNVENEIRAKMEHFM